MKCDKPSLEVDHLVAQLAADFTQTIGSLRFAWRWPAHYRPQKLRLVHRTARRSSGRLGTALALNASRYRLAQQRTTLQTASNSIKDISYRLRKSSALTFCAADSIGTAKAQATTTSPPPQSVVICAAVGWSTMDRQRQRRNLSRRVTDSHGPVGALT